MRLSLLLAVLLLTGCSTYTVPGSPAPKPERKLTDADKFALLKAEAEKRGLRWRVFCTSYYTDEEESFLAVAEHKEAPPRARYVEDGRMDEWMEQGATQVDAAFALYHSIQGAPTHPASDFHREKERERVRRMCPREISSEYPASIPKGGQ